MLERLNRFHGHGSVRRAYRLGRPVRTSQVTLHVLKNEKVKTTKAAVVVSRKVHKSAVKRNRIRRRIYEIVRQRLEQIKQPTELVFTVYSADLAEMPYKKLEQLVDELFSKAHI